MNTATDEEPVMTDEEYLQTQSQILLIAQLVEGLNLATFLTRVNRAEAIGPILDPSLYRKAGRRLLLIEELASNLLTFQMQAREPLNELRDSVSTETGEHANVRE